MSFSYVFMSRQFVLIFFLFFAISHTVIVTDNLKINQGKKKSSSIEPLVDPLPPIPQEPSIPANCLKIDPQNSSLCVQCSKNFDLTIGICIDSKCNVYSQELRKCLDNAVQTDFKKLQ